MLSCRRFISASILIWVETPLQGDCRRGFMKNMKLCLYMSSVESELQTNMLIHSIKYGVFFNVSLWKLTALNTYFYLSINTLIKIILYLSIWIDTLERRTLNWVVNSNIWNIWNSWNIWNFWNFWKFWVFQMFEYLNLNLSLNLNI